ncbi:acyltransferase [Flavobacterium sp. T-16]
MSNTSYTRYLRRKGMNIGQNVIFTNRTTLDIDMHKPTLVEIGNDVFINRGFSLLTHDYVSHVFLNVYHDYVSSTGKVVIGNNVAFGRNVSILKGVTIGDNVFIGFGSVVNKNIPSNCVAAGVPAKVICSLDEYYEKRKSRYVDEAFEYARSIKDGFGRRPIISDFYEEFPIFLNGSDSDKFSEILPIKSQYGKYYERFKSEHKSIFESFEEFISKAGL